MLYIREGGTGKYKYECQSFVNSNSCREKNYETHHRSARVQVSNKFLNKNTMEVKQLTSFHHRWQTPVLPLNHISGCLRLSLTSSDYFGYLLGLSWAVLDYQSLSLVISDYFWSISCNLGLYLGKCAHLGLSSKLPL